MNTTKQKIVCEHCGHRGFALPRVAWPIPCPRCGHDAAPSWWFRANNPDQKTKEKS